MPLWIITLFVLQFFRDPPRPVPQQPNAVLAPADGRIVAVEKVQDGYAGREALKISVFMNVFNVHSNRSSIDGTVEKIEYFPASSSMPTSTRLRARTRRNAVVIRRAADGQLVTLVQVARHGGAPVLHEGGRNPLARPALRLHPLRLAR